MEGETFIVHAERLLSDVEGGKAAVPCGAEPTLSNPKPKTYLGRPVSRTLYHPGFLCRHMLVFYIVCALYESGLINSL